MTRLFIKYVLPVAALALFVLAVWHVAGSGREPNFPSPPALAPPPVSPYPSAVAGAGIVEARTENIALGASLPGIVQEVFVAVGTRVKAGDPLFRLDDRELRAQLAIRQAALESAQKSLERLDHLPRPEEVPVAEAQLRETQAVATDRERKFYRLRKLLPRSTVTDEEVESAQYASDAAQATAERAAAQLELLKAGAWEYEKKVSAAAVVRAQAEVDEIQTDLDRLIVRASVDGEILQVNVRPGEYVGGTPGERLILLGNTEQLNIRVDIDENDIPRFQPGAPAEASMKGNPQKRFPLTFVRVEPFVVPKRSLTGDNTERIDTRVLQVIYRVTAQSAPRLYVGQQVDVYIESGEKTK